MIDKLFLSCVYILLLYIKRKTCELSQRFFSKPTPKVVSCGDWKDNWWRISWLLRLVAYEKLVATSSCSLDAPLPVGCRPAFLAQVSSQLASSSLCSASSPINLGHRDASLKSPPNNLLEWTVALETQQEMDPASDLLKQRLPAALISDAFGFLQWLTKVDALSDDRRTISLAPLTYIRAGL